MSTASMNTRRPTTVEVVESYLLEHLEGAWPAASEASPEARLVAAPPARGIEEEPVREPVDLLLEVASPPPAVDPDLMGVICFLIGPFRFLCPVDAVLDAPRHPYTRGLIDSVPAMNPRGRPLAQIPGNAPSPVDPRDALEVVRIIERAHALSAVAAE